MKNQLIRLTLLTLVLAQLWAVQPVFAGARPINTNVPITDLAADSLASAAAPALATHDGVLYAIWKDSRDHIATLGGDLYAIYFAKSSDGGATWRANTRLSNPTWDSTTIDTLSLAVGADGVLWALWHVGSCYTNAAGDLCDGADRTNDTRLALSDDGGVTWTELTVFDGDNSFSQSDQPALAVDRVNSMGYILNEQPVGNGYTLRLKFIDGNAVTTVSINNGTGRKYDASGPRRSLVARNGQVCIAWEDSQDGNAIYGSCSTDKGKTFAPPTAWSMGNAFAPQLSFAPDGALYLAYRQPKSLFVRRAATPGGAWGDPQPVALFNDDAIIDSLALTVDGKNAIALLYQSAGQGITDYDITLATSLDQGAQFAQVSLVDPALSKVTRRGLVALVTLASPGGDDNAVAVWEDRRNTSARIWSQRVALDSTPPTVPANLQVTAGDTSALLTWGAASDSNGIAGYHLFRGTNANGPFTQINPRLIRTTTYRDVGLAAGAYFYKVQAQDGTGNRGAQSVAVPVQVTAGTALTGLTGSIVYNVGNSLRLRTLTNIGGEQTIGDGTLPQIGSSGQRVYLKRGTALLSRKLDGSDERPLYEEQTLSGEPFGVSADGNTFAAAYTKPYFRFGNPVACTAFEPRVRTDTPAAAGKIISGIVGSEVALSPDGRWLAYLFGGLCNSTTVSVLDPPRLCLASATSDLSRCDEFDRHQPDFAPDGNTIAFVAVDSGQKEIWKASVNADGSLGDAVQLTQGAANQPADKPAWSTDGNWLIFQRDIDPGAGENWQLFVVRSDGDQLRALKVAGTDPDWAGGGGSAPAPTPTPIPLGNQRLFLPLVLR